jgi:hypothetical protein
VNAEGELTDDEKRPFLADHGKGRLHGAGARGHRIAVCHK